jgi:hypothetical protein
MISGENVIGLQAKWFFPLLRCCWYRAATSSGGTQVRCLMRRLHYSAGMTSMYDAHARHAYAKLVYMIVQLGVTRMYDEQRLRRTCSTTYYCEQYYGTGAKTRWETTDDRLLIVTTDVNDDQLLWRPTTYCFEQYYIWERCKTRWGPFLFLSSLQ